MKTPPNTPPEPALRIAEASSDAVASIASFNIAMALETESLELEADRVNKGVAAVIDDPSLGFYLVARLGDEIIGCLLVTQEWSDWRNGMFWWIQSVYVAPAHRGRGVYRRLYHEVVKRAMSDGRICGVRLYVEQENRIARRVYDALGMRDSGYVVFEQHLPPD